MKPKVIGPWKPGAMPRLSARCSTASSHHGHLLECGQRCRRTKTPCQKGAGRVKRT